MPNLPDSNWIVQVLQPEQKLPPTCWIHYISWSKEHEDIIKGKQYGAFSWCYQMCLVINHFGRRGSAPRLSFPCRQWSDPHRNRFCPPAIFFLRSLARFSQKQVLPPRLSFPCRHWSDPHRDTFCPRLSFPCRHWSDSHRDRFCPPAVFSLPSLVRSSQRQVLPPSYLLLAVIGQILTETGSAPRLSFPCRHWSDPHRNRFCPPAIFFLRSLVRFSQKQVLHENIRHAF